MDTLAFIATILTIFSAYIGGYIISSATYSTPQCSRLPLFIMCGIFIVLEITSYILSYQMVLIALLIFHMFLVPLFYKRNSRKAIACITYYYLIILTIFQSIIQKIGQFFLNDTLIGFIDLVSIVVFLGIIILLRNHNIFSKLYGYIVYISKSVRFMFSAALTLLCLMSVGITANELSVKPLFNLQLQVIMTATIIVMVLICLFLVFKSISETVYKNDFESINKQLQIQTEYYAQQNKHNAEIQRYRHDLHNHNLCITALAQNGDTKGILEYLGTEHLLTTVPSYKFNTGNEIVNALLTDKQATALQYNTCISFNGTLKYAFLQPIELCTIFGNLIDNAIDSVKKDKGSLSKKITIDVSNLVSTILITVKNPIFDECTIINNHIITSKKDTYCHGFGINNINEISKKYNGKLSLKKDKNIFVAHVLLYIN